MAAGPMNPWPRILHPLRKDVAFGAGLLAGAAASRLVRSLRPERRTTFAVPQRVSRAGTRAFEDELSALTLSGSEPGNALQLFDGTREYLEELFGAIARAQQEIWFEVFWWRDGGFADAMAKALLDALDRGVKVRLTVDGYGAQNGRPSTLAALRQAGAEVAVFAPLRPWSVHLMNKRTHRRILIIDHEVAYTGGVGIDDVWFEEHDDPPWADILLRVQGPAVRRLAGVFAEHWRLVTGDPLFGAPALRQHEPAGDARVQVLHSGPVSGVAGMRLAMLYALEAARDSVRIVTPYFIPDPLMVDRLVACRRRGGRVELILPSRKIDHQIVRRASRTTWGPLLRAGVKIFEHQPTLVHTKALLIDDAWCLVGSMNVDERSFRLNAEIAAGTADERVVKALRECMDAYRGASRLVGLEDWRARPPQERAMDRAAGVLRVQL